MNKFFYNLTDVVTEYLVLKNTKLSFSRNFSRYKGRVK